MVGCGLGEGMEPALQGLVTYLTDSAHNAQLFTTLAVFDTIAELAGGPLTASLMAIGRRPGHASDGYCFLASSVRIQMHSTLCSRLKDIRSCLEVLGFFLL